MKKYHRDVLNSFKPEKAPGKTAFIFFEEETVKISIYSKKMLQKEYKLKKKDFTYEIGIYIFSNVTKIIGFGNKSIDDAKIINLISDIKEIDFENNVECSFELESIESDKNIKKMMN